MGLAPVNAGAGELDGATGLELKQMPLFPLNTVLFPGMVLPLHIFEPRYRLMIQRCIKLEQPFGVVLIREGSEVGGPAVPHDVGTTAVITQANWLPDGRIDIQTVGQERFRIHGVRQQEPFMVGLVEDYPLEGADDPGAVGLADSLRLGLHAYLDALARATEAEVSLGDLPEAGLPLAYFAAIMLPLPLEDKQSILAMNDLASILKAENQLLKREMMLLQHVILSQRASPPDDEPTLFSQN